MSILNLMDVSDEKKTYDEALRFVSKIQINSNLLNAMKSLTESIFNEIQNDVSEALRIFSERCLKIRANALEAESFRVTLSELQDFKHKALRVSILFIIKT
jgi:hypothetical protein